MQNCSQDYWLGFAVGSGNGFLFGYTYGRLDGRKDGVAKTTMVYENKMKSLIESFLEKKNKWLKQKEKYQGLIHDLKEYDLALKEELTRCSAELKTLCQLPEKEG